MDEIDDVLDTIDSTVAEVRDKYGEPEGKESNVFVSCPKCGKTGVIHVDKGVIVEERDKLLFYGISRGMVCDHSFVVLIDSHLNTR